MNETTRFEDTAEYYEMLSELEMLVSRAVSGKFDDRDIEEGLAALELAYGDQILPEQIGAWFEEDVQRVRRELEGER